MTLLARLLHGFGARDRIPPNRCCGRRWHDLDSHRRFVHGETLAVLPCSECGAPSAGWGYDLMGDGQAIAARSLCAVHLAGLA